MAEQFNQEDKDELIERGFNNDQIEYLESLEMDPEGLFSDICHIMDDFGDTPEEIIESYREENNNNPPSPSPPPPPSQGGRRRKRTRKNRKGKKSHKKRSHKRRSHKRRY